MESNREIPKQPIFRVISLTAGILLSCLLAGCFDEPQGREGERTVAARVGESLIYLDEVDNGIPLKLYDLQEAIYQLRHARLQQMLDGALYYSAALPGAVGNNAAEILLQAPQRPRIGLPADTRPARGNPGAPVQLMVFCSYQSSHCVRLQPTLLKLLDRYEYLIGIRYFDFPLQYHRNGHMLAQAVRCAGDQGAGWEFQDHLLARVDTIERDDIPLLASNLALDVGHLNTCLDNRKYRNEIAYDIALGEKLGIGSVPVTFVNGLYLPGPQPIERFTELIDSELARLGIELTKARSSGLPLSQLPITLLACSVSNRPENSKALVLIKEKTAAEEDKSADANIRQTASRNRTDTDSDQARFYAPGSELISGVFLHKVERDRIIIDNKGRRELIRLWDGHREQTIAENDTERENSAAASDDIALPPPSAVLPLSRNWVDDRLLEQGELEQQIEQAEHEVQGHNLIKLSDEKIDEFYQTLGLETGDVLMRVNSQWMHSDYNPLWETLRANDKVTLVVMRRGLPVVYEYHIQ